MRFPIENEKRTFNNSVGGDSWNTEISSRTPHTTQRRRHRRPSACARKKNKRTQQKELLKEREKLFGQFSPLTGCCCCCCCLSFLGWFLYVYIHFLWVTQTYWHFGWILYIVQLYKWFVFCVGWIEGISHSGQVETAHHLDSILCRSSNDRWGPVRLTIVDNLSFTHTKNGDGING